MRFSSPFSPRAAKILVCLVAAIIAAVDFSLPSNVNIASFYFICLVLLIWTRSIKWLWSFVPILVLLTLGGVGVAPPAIANATTWIDWLNRSFTALALALAAIPVHLRLRAAAALEAAVAERDRSQQALWESHGNLEARVQERTRELVAEISDRARAEEKLRQSEKNLRRLSARLIRSQDEERRRIARELHDSLGQYLSHSKMLLESWLRKRDVSENGLQTMSQLGDSLDQCLTETRTISHLLHPPLLDELGFATAATVYADGFSRRSGIEVLLNIPQDMKRLPYGCELVLFRILQEGLTNVLRHAHSPTVDIQAIAEGAQVTLIVRDHGKGMRPEVVEAFNARGEGGGVGLSGMRERVLELNGDLRIESNGQGTIIRVTIPLERTEKLAEKAEADRPGSLSS